MYDVRHGTGRAPESQSSSERSQTWPIAGERWSGRETSKTMGDELGRQTMRNVCMDVYRECDWYVAAGCVRCRGRRMRTRMGMAMVNVDKRS